MKEIDIQNEIRIALSQYAVMFRVNSGKVKMMDGRFFDTGVPNGHPDLYGFRKSDGKLIYIEVKNEKGKLRADQKHFIEQVSKYPLIVGVCRSAEEAVKLVLEG
jgi:hypothetical protein